MRIAICGGIAPQVISKQENDIGLVVWRRTGSKRCPNQDKEKKDQDNMDNNKKEDEKELTASMVFRGCAEVSLL